MIRVWLFMALLIAPVQALDPGEALSDPALEMRARALSQELRCMVCQNQSIDDSDAPLAKDLRMFVRNRLQAGDSDDAIRKAVVERYGEFALFRPRVAPHTLALWLMPVVILVLGGLMARRFVGKSTRQNTSTASE